MIYWRLQRDLSDYNTVSGASGAYGSGSCAVKTPMLRVMMGRRVDYLGGRVLIILIRCSFKYIHLQKIVVYTLIRAQLDRHFTLMKYSNMAG